MKVIQLYIILSFFFSFSCNSQENIVEQINPNLFGFNTSNTFTYCDVNDTSFTNKVQKIKPNVLRFPGGTISNFYHYDEKAYGLDISEISDWNVPKFTKRYNGLIKEQKKRNHNHNYIEDFILLAKKNNSKVVLVANIISSEDDDIINMIKRFKSENIEILGVELGSELSNRAYKKYINSVDDYIHLAQKYSNIIKKEYPEIKVGVVAAPIKYNMPSRLLNWNQKLSEETFYDAIIHHSYLKVIDGDDDYGLMTREDEVSSTKKAQFDLYKKRIKTYFTTGFVKEIIEYNEIFEKEIWITEWNLQMSKTTGNTLLQSLFVSQYLLELLSNPDLQNISIATYHNLAGRDISGSVFKGIKGGFEIHSTYYPLTFLSKIFENDIIRIEKEVKDDVFIYYCFDSTNNLKISFDINWEKNEFILSENMGTDSVYVTKYLSEDLFDMSDEEGKL
ncbi:MAG: hypothetical protein HN594_04450 [Flavobacteriales bacterium]|nr:hypothetical protein [Flavobacteriales bacterium]